MKFSPSILGGKNPPIFGNNTQRPRLEAAPAVLSPFNLAAVTVGRRQAAGELPTLVGKCHGNLRYPPKATPPKK